MRIQHTGRPPQQPAYRAVLPSSTPAVTRPLGSELLPASPSTQGSACSQLLVTATTSGGLAPAL